MTTWPIDGSQKFQFAVCIQGHISDFQLSLSLVRWWRWSKVGNQESCFTVSICFRLFRIWKRKMLLRDDIIGDRCIYTVYVQYMPGTIGSIGTYIIGYPTTIPWMATYYCARKTYRYPQVISSMHDFPSISNARSPCQIACFYPITLIGLRNSQTI